MPPPQPKHPIFQVIDVVKKLVRSRSGNSFGGAWTRVFDAASADAPLQEFCEASLFAHVILSDAMTSELHPIEAIFQACEHQFERKQPCYPCPITVIPVYGQVRRANGPVYCLAHVLAIKKVSRG